MDAEFIVALGMFWVVGALFTGGIWSGTFTEAYMAECSTAVKYVANIIIGVSLIFLWPCFLGRYIAEVVVEALKSRGSCDKC